VDDVVLATAVESVGDIVRATAALGGSVGDLVRAATPIGG
jgi:hypothetical protein